jgi:hypothetical protein
MQARQQLATPREEYVLAFTELGIDPHWDGREPVRAYIEREYPHLLRVYDVDFLVNAVECVHRKETLGTNPEFRQS